MTELGEADLALAQAAQGGCRSPSLEAFKRCLDIVPGDRLEATLFEQEAGPDDLQQSLPTSTPLRGSRTFEPPVFGFMIWRLVRFCSGRHRVRAK